ncbi:unnamed protein product, partial [Didymodactylos carnosus]
YDGYGSTVLQLTVTGTCLPKPKTTTQNKLEEIINKQTEMNEFGKRTLQSKSQSYMNELFGHAQICSQNAGRKNIKLFNISCALKFRAEDYGVDIGLPQTGFTLELPIECDLESVKE